jgi:hypothetical protein
MLKSLFGEKKLVFDPTLGDSLAGTILKEAERGQVSTLLKKDQSLRSGEWDRRFYYIELAGKTLSRTDQVPDTPLGNLLKGSAAINSAWAARGHGGAETVSAQGWALFEKQLISAHQFLLTAAEQDREDPTGLVFLLTVAQGLQLDRTSATAWLKEALRRDPLNQQAHYRYLFLTLKKWGGSHEEMYAFARETMARTPPTSTLYPILYLAFQEYYLYQLAFAKNREAAFAFLADPAVRQESLAIYQNSLAKRKSIERISDYWPHNVAIWWFMVLKMPEIVRQETKKVGSHFTQFPWTIFFEDPVAGYQKALNL